MHVYWFAVSPGQPNSISDDAEAVTLTGSSQDAVSQINQKEIHWGVSQQSYLVSIGFAFFCYPLFVL